MAADHLYFAIRVKSSNLIFQPPFATFQRQRRQENFDQITQIFHLRLHCGFLRWRTAIIFFCIHTLSIKTTSTMSTVSRVFAFRAAIPMEAICDARAATAKAWGSTIEIIWCIHGLSAGSLKEKNLQQQGSWSMEWLNNICMMAFSATNMVSIMSLMSVSRWSSLLLLFRNHPFQALSFTWFFLVRIYPLR